MNSYRYSMEDEHANNDIPQWTGQQLIVLLLCIGLLDIIGLNN
jgi:hypothetical protein